MVNKSPGAWSLVLVPAVIALVVTVVRLVGELQGWNDTLFSNVAPGADPKPGLVGIAWLVPIFGLWFGFKLRRGTGEPARIGKSALVFAIGGVLMVGGFMGCVAAGLVTMPSAEAPGEPTGLPYSLALVAISAITMWFAWPRLATTLLLYGILSRIPVIAVTYLALENGWDTHHTKLPVGMVLPADAGKLMFLAMPQMTFWIVFTMMVGGLFGCLGAALAGRRSK